MTPVELIQQFIIATPNVIIGSDDGVIRMPFRCQYKDRAFYIHIRQISSAYFPNRPDVTRIQLAKNSAFDNITKDNCDLLYLGYDNDNDVYVCWDYRLLKERLNQAKNVSLYSLKSQQGKVQKKQIIQFKLENGDSPVCGFSVRTKTLKYELHQVSEKRQSPLLPVLWLSLPYHKW